MISKLALAAAMVLATAAHAEPQAKKSFAVYISGNCQSSSLAAQLGSAYSDVYVAFPDWSSNTVWLTDASLDLTWSVASNETVYATAFSGNSTSPDELTPIMSVSGSGIVVMHNSHSLGDGINTGMPVYDNGGHIDVHVDCYAVKPDGSADRNVGFQGFLTLFGVGW